MTTTKKRPTDGKVEIASQAYHLVQGSSDSKALCGVSAHNVKIGAYVEHLVTQGNSVEWVRGIFGADGKPVSEACGICLSIYPSALRRVNPFDVCINLHFEENKALRNSYTITASGTATIEDICNEITVSPAIISFTARWIGELRFPVHMDLASIVPWVEQANKRQIKDGV